VRTLIIDYVSRMGRESVRHLMIMSFTIFLIELQILWNTRNLTGSKIGIEQIIRLKLGEQEKNVFLAYETQKGKDTDFLRHD
jgi:hypothetical protein